MMYLVRLIFFVALSYTVVMGWWFVWCPLVVWYVYRYTAYELLLLGLFIDYGFGILYTWPWYLTGFAIMLVIVEWIKPRLLVYTETT